MPKPSTIRRGNVVVLVALLIPVILGMVAIAIDLSWLSSAKNQLESAADSCVLATANWIGNQVMADQDINKQTLSSQGAVYGRDFMATNPIDNITVVPDIPGDIQTGTVGWTNGRVDPNTFEPDDENYNALRVHVKMSGASDPPQALPAHFGTFFGHEYYEPEAIAIAEMFGSTGQAILALCPFCECSFDVSGTPVLDVGAASINVNSAADQCPACGNGTPDVVASQLNITGPEFCQTPQVEVTGEINLDVDPIPDPLAGLPAPAWDPSADLACNTGPVLSPGYYSVGIKHTSGTLTLNPGVYVLNGASDLSAPDITIDFDPGDPSGIVFIDETDFVYNESEWTGGIVENGGPDSPYAASGEQYYHIGPAAPGGSSVSLDPPASAVTFFFVHDLGIGVGQGTATPYDICGSPGTAVVSKQATSYAAPGNFVTINASVGLPIRRIAFTNGIVDAMTYTQVNGGLHIGGSAPFYADGVMLYIAGGEVDINGNSDVIISPPSSGTYEKVSIFQARNNFHDAAIMGTSLTEITGTLYFPGDGVSNGPLLEVGGTPLSFGNQLIAWNLWLHGTSDMIIDYDGFSQLEKRVRLVY